MDEEFNPSSVLSGDYESIIDSQAPPPQVLHSRNSDIQSFKGLTLTGRADDPLPQLILGSRGQYILWTVLDRGDLN